MDSTDRKRLAAEVSVLHGIRIDPDDPMMAVVTLNRLVLEGALNEALSAIRAAVEEFNQAAERVQVRAGSAVGREIRECVASIREALQKDMNEARLHACKVVEEPHQIQSRWMIVPWIAAGVMGGAVLVAAGFCLGMLLR